MLIYIYKGTKFYSWHYIRRPVRGGGCTCLSMGCQHHICSSLGYERMFERGWAICMALSVPLPTSHIHGFLRDAGEDQHKEAVQDVVRSPGQADFSQDVMMAGSLWTPRKQITNSPTPLPKLTLSLPLTSSSKL